MKYRVLYSQLEIEIAIERMAHDMEHQLPADQEIVFVCVLKGAFMFASKLFTCYRHPASIQFVSASSYKGTTAKQGAVMVDSSRMRVAGRHVVILEDIVDSGDTISTIRKHALGLGANSVRLATLLHKPMAHHAAIGAEPDFVGIRIPDKFVIGYGLDYQERYRNLPYIAEVVEP